MSYYAFLNSKNIVTEVIAGVPTDQAIEGKTPEEWYSKLKGKKCKATSIDGEFRKNYAGIGFKYDSGRDAFIAPQPFDSWVLNEETCQWEAPIPRPDDEKQYLWDEETTSWVVVEEN